MNAVNTAAGASILANRASAGESSLRWGVADRVAGSSAALALEDVEEAEPVADFVSGSGTLVEGCSSTTWKRVCKVHAAVEGAVVRGWVGDWEVAPESRMLETAGETSTLVVSHRDLDSTLASLVDTRCLGYARQGEDLEAEKCESCLPSEGIAWNVGNEVKIKLIIALGFSERSLHITLVGRAKVGSCPIVVDGEVGRRQPEGESHTRVSLVYQEKSAGGTKMSKTRLPRVGDAL